jgi:hypothetical protein
MLCGDTGSTTRGCQGVSSKQCVWGRGFCVKRLSMQPAGVDTAWKMACARCDRYVCLVDGCRVYWELGVLGAGCVGSWVCWELGVDGWQVRGRVCSRVLCYGAASAAGGGVLRAGGILLV